MKALSMILFCLTFIGCASTQMLNVRVESEPTGAQIDVNGISVGNTPTEVNMSCSKSWVGFMYSPDGWNYSNTTYQITAAPSSTNPGYTQTKYINPCQWKGNQPPVIDFDLGLEKVAPTQKIELNATGIAQPDAEKEALESLKKLHDQGILSDAEYKDKALKVIDQYSK